MKFWDFTPHGFLPPKNLKTLYFCPGGSLRGAHSRGTPGQSLGLHALIDISFDKHHAHNQPLSRQSMNNDHDRKQNRKNQNCKNTHKITKVLCAQAKAKESRVSSQSLGATSFKAWGRPYSRQVTGVPWKQTKGRLKTKRKSLLFRLTQKRNTAALWE